MQIIAKLDEWRAIRRRLPTDASLGFAPTMGNLHAGHASLFAISKQENQYSVSSLYVNPKQFNNPKDFALYPRTLDQDLALMEAAGLDFCLLPEEGDLYPDNYQYQVQEHALAELMEGKYRPGHFTGMLTVVLKLLHLTNPTQAYFGEKDYQQFLLIKGMSEALFLPTTIKACPTIREASGLAYSSRNNRLTAEQRKLAETFAQLFHQPKPCEAIKTAIEEAGIQVEYLEEYQNRRYAAVLIGDVRLIDNYAI